MDGDGFSFEEQIRDLQLRLTELEKDHRALDQQISELQAHGADPLTLQRLKRNKLHLRDEISRLRGLIYPNIIA